MLAQVDHRHQRQAGGIAAAQVRGGVHVGGQQRESVLAVEQAQGIAHLGVGLLQAARIEQAALAQLPGGRIVEGLEVVQREIEDGAVGQGACCGVRRGVGEAGQRHVAELDSLQIEPGRLCGERETARPQGTAGVRVAGVGAHAAQRCGEGREIRAAAGDAAHQRGGIQIDEGQSIGGDRGTQPLEAGALAQLWQLALVDIDLPLYAGGAGADHRVAVQQGRVAGNPGGGREGGATGRVRAKTVNSDAVVAAALGGGAQAEVGEDIAERQRDPQADDPDDAISRRLGVVRGGAERDGIGHGDRHSATNPGAHHIVPGEGCLCMTARLARLGSNPIGDQLADLGEAGLIGEGCGQRLQVGALSASGL